jgi:hypothetical protein
VVVLAGVARGTDELFLEVETFTSADGLVTLTRPNAEWAFLDLEVQKREAGQVLSPGQFTRAFRDVVARAHHPGLRATLSVYVVRSRPEPDLEALVTRAREAAAASSGTVKGLKKARVSGYPGVQVDYVVAMKGVPDQPDGNTWIRRVECALAGRSQVVILVFEVPLESWKSVKGEHKAFLKKVKLLGPVRDPGKSDSR